MMKHGVFLALAAAVVLTGCGEGGDSSQGAQAPAVPTADAPSPTPSAAPSQPAANPAPAPATGTTHEVQLLGDAKGYRFEPASLNVKAGDAIKFVMVSGGPHNVAFDPAALPAAVVAQLKANMPEQMAELSGKMLLNPNESYTISFAGVAPGTYEFNCAPHAAMGMKGKVTVE